jgi:hypothetical protein
MFETALLRWRSAASMTVSPPPVAEIDDATTPAAVGDGGGRPRHIFRRISRRVGVLPLDIDWRCGVRFGSIVCRRSVGRPRCRIAGRSVSRPRCHVARRSVCVPRCDMIRRFVGGSRCPITRCPITQSTVGGARRHVRRLSASWTRRHINPGICDIDTPGRDVDRLQFACRDLRRR